MTTIASPRPPPDEPRRSGPRAPPAPLRRSVDGHTLEPLPEPAMAAGALARPDALRPALAALVFMSVQAVLFGMGALLLLATPLSARADSLMAPMIVVTAIASAVVAWRLAPRLRARNWLRPRRG